MKPSQRASSLGPTYLPPGGEIQRMSVDEHHLRAARTRHARSARASSASQCGGSWRMRYSPTAPPTRTTSRTSPPSRATARRRRHSAREAQDARHRQRAVEAFVRRKVKEKVINEDGTTEVKATERVNKQHLVQALLMLATAETRSSVPTRRSSHCAAQGQSTSSR